MFDGLDFVGLYLDDIVIASATFEDNLTHLTEVFRRLETAGLTVKLRKCEFACKEIEYLGHKVGLGQISPRELKVKAIVDVLRPQTRRQLRSLLGLVGVFQRFIPNFADLTAH
jgi:hypothetical protein